MKRNRPLVVSVVGARPQFIKLAALAGKLEKAFTHRIVHTGQHYDSRMSAVFFRQLALPNVDRNLRIGSGTHAEMTARMLTALDRYFVKQKPDMVLVYGDTNTTLAGALTAAKLGIPVGHIEAGLRSFVPAMPEEINRRVTDHLAALLFCPTPAARRNLAREGIRRGVIESGDLMYELLHDCRPTIRRNGRFLNKYGLSHRDFYYLTLHRAGTVDNKDKLEQVLTMLTVLDRPVLFPVHPRTAQRLKLFRLNSRLEKMPQVLAVKPLTYIDNLTAAANAHTVLTDSGGLQKEALFLGTPVLTLREETEWTETLKRGNRLVGLSPERLKKALRRPVKVRPPAMTVRGKRPSHHIINAIKQSLKTER